MSRRLCVVMAGRLRSSVAAILIAAPSLVFAAGANRVLGPSEGGSGVYRPESYVAAGYVLGSGGDDSPAVIAAINAAYAAGGGRVTLPSIHLKALASIMLRSRVRVEAYSTTITCGVSPCVTQPANSQLYRAGFVGASLVAGAGQSGADAIKITNAQHSEIGNLFFSGFTTGTLLHIAANNTSIAADYAALKSNVIFNSFHDFTEWDAAAEVVKIDSAYGSTPPSPFGGGGVTTLNEFRNFNVRAGVAAVHIVANADTNWFYNWLISFSAQGAKGIVQGDDPQFSQTAAIVAGGSGYTASANGVATYTGAGCTTNPVVGVQTNSSGVIVAPIGFSTLAVCSTYPTGSTAWTVTGLGAGSGLNMTVVNSPANTYVNNNKFYGLAFSDNYLAQPKGLTLFAGDFSYGTEVFGLNSDIPYYSTDGVTPNYTIIGMTGARSYCIHGNNMMLANSADGSANTYLNNMCKGVYNKDRTLAIAPGSGFVIYSSSTTGYDKVWLTNASLLAAGQVQTPCNAQDGDRFSEGSVGGVTAFTLGICAGSGDHITNPPTTLSAGLVYHFRYIASSKYWIPD